MSYRSGNTFGINAPLPSRFIQVAATTIRTSQVWQNLDIPYRLFGTHFIEEATTLVSIKPRRRRAVTRSAATPTAMSALSP